MQIFRIIGLAWWIGLALAPVLIWHFVDQLTIEIGCPARGDCYAPGSINSAYLRDLTTCLAIFIWPPCVWNLGLGSLARSLRSFRPRAGTDSQSN